MLAREAFSEQGADAICESMRAQARGATASVFVIHRNSLAIWMNEYLSFIDFVAFRMKIP